LKPGLSRHLECAVGLVAIRLLGQLTGFSKLALKTRPALAMLKGWPMSVAIGLTVPRLCVPCGGKGFHWRKQLLVADDGSNKVLADLYRQGEVCQACRGSGRYSFMWANRLWIILATVALALAASAFLIQPALHLIFD
jgi:hypothetical protein